MILATTIAPVDLSLLIVAPLGTMISEWKDDGQRGQAVDGENNMLVLLHPRHASYLESLHSSEGYLYHLADCLHVTHKALEKVIQISIIFNRCYWCGANRNGKSILCSRLQSAHTRV